ncbi:MAG: MmgE/PrpD family protein [Dehalococcoidia bacterium]|nr:MmgE/PrpD family protein [Dehalococcoidia bacterium]
MPTQKLAEYIGGLSFNVIPHSAKQNCKELILDTLGVALRGSGTKHGKIAADFAKDFADKKEATIIGYGHKSSCLNAAFANSVMAHALDFDDCYDAALIHAGCVIIPAALAMGEVEGISGKDFITAVIGGYDVSCRVAACIFPWGNTPLGQHVTGTANCFGAAAVAGKILRLGRDELVSAFGIAGDSAAGLRQYREGGDMSKSFHAGKAAQNGILAALLAHRGFAGPPRILEGRFGFCRVFSQDHYNLAELTKGLGEEFKLSQSSVKPYPSCRHTHGAIEAALTLQRKYNLEVGGIEKVVLHTYDMAVRMTDTPLPETVLQAILSQQYCIATALVRRRVSVNDFYFLSSERSETERVRELMEKIEVVESSEFTKVGEEKHSYPSELEIVMRDGKILTQRIDYPLGSPERPMPDLELTNKFRDLACSVLSETKLEELMNSIVKLEQVGDVRELAEFLY